MQNVRIIVLKKDELRLGVAVCRFRSRQKRNTLKSIKGYQCEQRKIQASKEASKVNLCHKRGRKKLMTDESIASDLTKTHLWNRCGQ
jgi:hypothetical protein